MNTEQMIEKIRKLLELGGNNPNENEATEAIKKASALMARHAISMADIDATKNADQQRVEETVMSWDLRSQWISVVWYAVAELNFTKYWRSKKGLNDVYHLIGTRANIAATKVMAEYLIATVKRLSGESGLPARQEPAFKKGAGARLATRLWNLKKQRQAGPTEIYLGTTLPALAPLYNMHEQENDALFAELHTFKLRTTRGSSTKNVNAYRLGLKAGDGIGLDTQIDRQNRTALE